MSLDALLARVARDKRQRLRWRIARLFGVFPGSKAVRRMSDVDCLLCGCNLLLDMGADAENPAFDAARFASLKEGAQ